MSGDPILQAKEAILQIMEGLIEGGVLAEKDIVCFFFQSSCQEILFSDDPEMLWVNGGIKQCIDRVVSGGGNYYCS